MNKAYIRLLGANILLLIITILNSFLNFLNSYTIILFLLLYFVFVYYFIGYERNSKRYQKDIIIVVLIISLSYYIITYLSGLFIGFNQTGYSFKFLDILKNILPVLLLIPLAELIRYVLVSKGYIYKSIIIFIFINFVMLDITLFIHAYNSGIINFVLEILIPSIAKNILLIYLVYKAGYKPTIVYRLIFEIPVYILPIFPSLGLYLGPLVSFLFPMLSFYLFYNSFRKHAKTEISARKKINRLNQLVLVFFSLFLILVIALTSGLFNYFAITIGSNSMVPNINKGDILIVDRVTKEEINELKIKEILVFKHDNIIIVHRIVRILEVNGEKYFYTKGDNNNSDDGYPIRSEDAIGTIVMRIPYAGMLTVQIQELINKK